jgi:hypothetical protein
MNDHRIPQDEGRLDELIGDLARDYNLPPDELDEYRRERMFAAIQARRRNRPRTPAPRRYSQALRWAAMAAVLLIGIAIGRWQPHQIDSEVPETVAEEPARGATNLYRFAARDYLQRTGDLLAMMQHAAYSPDVPSMLGAGTADPTVRWARELLRESRRLQDSPATKGDPQLERLLQDLELLLAEIVQAANANPALRAEDTPLADPEALQRLRAEIDRSTIYNEI